MTQETFTLAGGERAVALGAAGPDVVIVTGDGNVVSLTRQNTFAFHLLDEAFRQQQAARAPAAFYDGARPNWANIARGDDAHRTLYAALWDFATRDDLPPHRVGVILGLAGEGKTTFLLRLAWDLAEAGYPVLARHSGTILPNTEMPLDGRRPLILCFDEIDREEELPQLAADLQAIGLPFVILGSARLHEWRHAGLESELRAVARVQPFRLGPVDETEARAILAKLEAAGKLDRLAHLSPEDRLRHFLNRQQADGQLLPALLTARSGAVDFQHFVLSVLNRIRGWPEGEFLLQGYAYIAAVHRFGFWLERDLLASLLDRDPADIGPALVRPLEGELLEVTEQEVTELERQLSTRHPVIAEVAFTQLTTGNFNVPDESDLYERLFTTLGNLRDLRQRDGRSWHKLLTMLPLAFQRRGEYDKARRLFHMASEADPTNAPTWQAWAVMEARLGDYQRARELFERGTRADPTDAPTWQAWAVMEARLGYGDHALKILEEGLRYVRAPRDRALLLSTKGGTLARMRRFEEAEAAFQAALALHEQDPLTHYHYAWDCLRPQGRREEACRHLRRARELRPRKPRHRKRIAQALRQLGCEAGE